LPNPAFFNEGRVNTESLQALIHIVDIGSIQGAARHLGVTRASLRRTIALLEEDVGVSLLHRDSSGVRLTAAGSVLLERGRELLESSRVLLTEVRAAGAEPMGTLRVFEPVGMPLLVSAQVLMVMRSMYPRMRYAISQFEDPLAHVQEPFELMLHEGPPPAGVNMFSREILRVPLRLMASEDYLERHGTPESVADLADHQVLGWRRPRQRADEWPLLAGGTLSVSPWLTSPDPLMLMTLATAGAGILLGPRLPLPEPGTESMVKVLEDQVGGELIFRVSSPLPGTADSRTRGAVAQILKQLEELPEPAG
jgi:DNA-binding transcriptional LysR family regulator